MKSPSRHGYCSTGKENTELIFAHRLQLCRYPCWGQLVGQAISGLRVLPEKVQQKNQTLLHPGFWRGLPDSNWRRPAAARLPPAPIITRFAREVASSNGASEKQKTQTLLHPGFWSCWPDSNWRPHPYQGCALPTELQQQSICPLKRGICGDREGT